MILKKDVLDAIVNILALSIGSLTNPMNIYKTYISNGNKDISLNTITSYIEHFKYYFTDLDVRLNFKQQEERRKSYNGKYNLQWTPIKRL